MDATPDVPGQAGYPRLSSALDSEDLLTWALTLATRLGLEVDRTKPGGYVIRASDRSLVGDDQGTIQEIVVAAFSVSHDRNQAGKHLLDKILEAVRCRAEAIARHATPVASTWRSDLKGSYFDSAGCHIAEKSG